ncbi:MAG: DUF4249 domain-containing protein, partial [Bacteroidota bacterium]|nr:DUF4249 domain-containing protein [Bacteroidota bacterium]MDX5430428.1 DUF4249 domain-containing protein [Bacteroidota bacterium]MDX5469187.1 DUF4249 domain-containing protein [Bacteroidota bacterium]
MKKFAYILFAAVFFTACEKDADIPLPETKPMMALYGFLEADEQVSIRLEKVVPAFSAQRQDPGPISGALVLLKAGDSTYVLEEDVQIPGLYQVPGGLTVKAGASYSVQASKSGYPDVKSSCVVPTYVAGDLRFDYVATVSTDPSLDSNRRVAFYWKDEPNAKNYYRYTAIARFPVNAEVLVWFSDENVNDFNQEGKEL